MNAILMTEDDFKELLEDYVPDDEIVVKIQDYYPLKQVIEFYRTDREICTYETITVEEYPHGFEKIFKDNYAWTLLDSLECYDEFFSAYKGLAEWYLKQPDVVECFKDKTIQYLKYVARWHKDHSGEEFKYMKPACLYEWEENEGLLYE